MSDEVKPFDLVNWSEKSSDELSAQRFKICQSCELFNKENQTCTKCNCFMKTKTTLLNVVCPIGKW